MWKLDYKESWAPKTWCFWTVMLEKTLESSLDCKEIQPVHPKWNQSWIFIGRSDVEAETPIILLPDGKNWLIGKDHSLMLEWLKAGREGNDRGWDGRMASPTQWTWAWVSSGSWWWIGKPCMLQSTGLQRVVHNWVTELNWLSLNLLIRILSVSYKFSWISLAFNFTFPQFINKNPSEVSIKCLYFIYFVYCCCCSTPKLCPTLLRPDGL